jgi:hypothetical protein
LNWSPKTWPSVSATRPVSTVWSWYSPSNKLFPSF